MMLPSPTTEKPLGESDPYLEVKPSVFPLIHTRTGTVCTTAEEFKRGFWSDNNDQNSPWIMATFYFGMNSPEYLASLVDHLWIDNHGQDINIVKFLGKQLPKEFKDSKALASHLKKAWDKKYKPETFKAAAAATTTDNPCRLFFPPVQSSVKDGLWMSLVYGISKIPSSHMSVNKHRAEIADFLHFMLEIVAPAIEGPPSLISSLISLNMRPNEDQFDETFSEFLGYLNTRDRAKKEEEVKKTITDSFSPLKTDRKERELKRRALKHAWDTLQKWLAYHEQLPKAELAKKDFKLCSTGTHASSIPSTTEFFIIVKGG